MREERDRLAGELSAVIQTADTYHEELQHVPGVAPLRDIAQAIRAESDEMLEDGRLLHLGIVGQIKAGKSTLLNLLLFGGNEVLPRAATPMTAALTHIVRSDAVGADHAEIDVEYYSTEEWHEIEGHARECQKEEDAGRSPGEFLRACTELVEMAEKRGIRVTDHAGTETESVSIDRLNDRLCSLVGAQGELTPLVRNVTIRCGRGIPDLDVVDTPGLNDPVPSRVRATRKLLGKCDAVLVLSYAGQFMDSSDLDLLTHTLPAEGIRECVLISSKFDSALIDVARDHRGDLQAAAEDIERQLRDRIERMSDEDADVRLASERVLFMSALCATLGVKPCALWSVAECDVFAALRRCYPDWLDPPQNGVINDATKSNLTNLLGRTEEVDDAIQAIRADKDGIMERKIRDYLQEKEAGVRSHIETVIADLEQKQEELRSGDLDTLEDRKKAVVRSIDEMGSEISEEWSRLISSQMGGLDTARRRCHEAVDEGRRAVPDSIEVKPVRRPIRKKPGFLGLAWLVRSIRGISHDDYKKYERKVMKKTWLRAKLEEARDNVRSHVDRELRKMFSIGFAADARKKLLTVCAGAMDNTTASEAKPSFARSLGSAVEQMSEQARLSLRDSRASAELDVLSVDLSGDMQQKESAAFDYANVLRRAVDSIFEAAEATAKDVNKKAAAELLPVARRDLEKYHERLQQEIKDKVFALQRYDMAIRDLERHGRRLARADSAQDR